MTSYSLLLGMWDALRTLKKYYTDKGAMASELESTLIKSSFRGTVPPFSSAIRVLSNSKLVTIEHARLRITKDGQKLLDTFPEENPPLRLLRILLEELIKSKKPLWVYPINSFPIDPIELVRLPEAILNVLQKCELLEDTDDNQQWWEKIIEWSYSKDNSYQEVLGARGEEYVMKYERKRLKPFGLDNKIQQVSSISDDYGFDIDSFAGELKENPGEPLFIEVKTSNSKHYIKFHLTRHQWNTMEKNKDNYLIYYVGNFSDEEKRIIKTITYKELHSAEPNCEIGHWESFYFYFPDVSQ